MLKLIETTDHPAPTGNSASAYARTMLDAIETDWRSVSGFGNVPDQSSLDPGQLYDVLPYCFVLSKTGANLLRVRVAGQRLHDMLGHDPRGMSVGAFFTARTRPTMLNLLGSMLTPPAILEVPLISARTLSRRRHSATLIALPLRDQTGAVTKIMGAIVPDNPVAGTRIRYDLNAAHSIRHDRIADGQIDRRSSRANLAPPAVRLVVDNVR